MELFSELATVFGDLITVPNIAFCLIVWVLVWVQRKVFHLFFKKVENSKVYRELFLPLGPLGTGGILAALVTSFPYPLDIHTVSGRIMFGVIAGLFSAHIYKMVKPFLPEKMMIKSLPPPPPSGTQ
jgi:hypothetical protein